MKKLIFFGAGGHAIACRDILKQKKEYDLKAVFDPNQNKLKDLLFFKKKSEIKKFKFKYAHIAIGSIKNLRLREKLFSEGKKMKFIFPIIKSKFSIISKYSILEEGTIIFNNVIIMGESKIGKNCIINNNSLIDHNSHIGDHSHISTGVIINGNCHIGKNCFIGTGSILLNNVKLKDNTFIKAGTLVKK